MPAGNSNCPRPVHIRDAYEHTRSAYARLVNGKGPSKALLDSTHKLLDAQRHFAEHGIDIAGVKVDLARMLARKDAVVKKMTSGVK